MSDASGALAGLRVVEVADEWGELCGKLLLNMGAEVTKVERPGGAATRRRPPLRDGESLWFRYLNAGKRSATLDGKVGEAPAFHDMLAEADVLVLSGHPLDLAAAGLDPEGLAPRHAALVVAVVTPFGRRGPWAAFRANDLVSLALGGVLNTCGYDETGVPPVRPGGGQAYNAGGVFAATGVMLALLERDLSGRGQVVDVPVHACLACTTENSNIWWIYLRQLLHRQAGRHATAEPTPPSQLLCGDGRYLNWMPPRAPGEWEAFVAWLDAEGMAADLKDERFANPRARLSEAGHVFEVMAAFCRAHTAEEVYLGGQERGFSWGAVRRPEDLLDDIQLQARGFFVVGEDGLPYPGAPYRLSRTPWRPGAHVPAIGEHNGDALRDVLLG